MKPEQSGSASPLVTNVLLAIAFLVFVYWLAYTKPVAYIFFISEDCWAEFATSVGFLVAAVFFAATVLRSRARRKLGYVALALATLVVAGEEISWGERLLGLQVPEVFQEHNNQSEMNVHNFVMARRYYPLIGPMILLFAVAVPWLPRVSGRIRDLYERFGVPVVAGRVLPLFLLSAFTLYSGVIGYLPEYPELMELFLGMAFAVMAVDLFVTNGRGNRTAGSAPAFATIGAVAAIWILTVPLVHFHGRPTLRNDLNKYAAFRLPAEGLLRQADMVFDYLLAHPDLPQDDTLLNQALILRETGRDREADRLLREELAEQLDLQRERPEDPDPFRSAGRILGLLGESGAEQWAFEAALEKDRARLGEAAGGLAEWSVRWSLGKTLYAMGDRASAREELAKAEALAPDDRRRREVRRWLSWEERRRERLESGGMVARARIAMSD